MGGSGGKDEGVWFLPYRHSGEGRNPWIRDVAAPSRRFVTMDPGLRRDDE
jgi:hypothetical protein